MIEHAELYKDVAERYIKSSNENHISISDELKMLEFLVNKYALITISDYAKKEKISYNGTLKRLESKKLPYIILCKQTFIIQ